MTTLTPTAVLAALSWEDWTVICAFLAVSMLVGLWFTRRAGRSIEEYFVGGRSLPWWLAGTSMVATTFAADTPLAITELVRKYGIYENWYWWCIGFGQILTVVLLARLWRRSEVRTDLQLIELRYSGPGADALRGFRAVYFGVIANVWTMAWVTAAMLSIASESMFGHGAEGGSQAVRLDVPVRVTLIAVLMLSAGMYTIFSGLWGVVVTDLLQFVVAMVGAIALAVFAVASPEVGGMSGLLDKLAGSEKLAIVPPASSIRFGFEAGVLAFAVYVGLFWWTDKSIDQGGYLAQRMLACRNENHALGASMWFAVAHYGLRCWPWIIAALVTLVLFAGETDHKATYTMLAMRVMGPWWRGLLIASLLAAFISTINTQINWGASYLLNDLYQRYLVTGRSPGHYVFVGRLFSVGLMVVAGLVAYCVQSIVAAWQFVALLWAGGGLVLLGRWLWWRVNAFSELAALASALACSIVFAILGRTGVGDYPFAYKLLWIVPIVTCCWVAVTFLTRPTRMDRLVEFVRKIRPPGPGWGPVHAEAGTSRPRGLLSRIIVAWLGGAMLIYGVLFLTGQVLFGNWPGAALWAGCAVVGGGLFFAFVPRLRRGRDRAMTCT